MRDENVTVYDIAKMCNCSPATVSLALNNDKRVAKVTKERVQEIARQMKYKPNYFGRGLITGKTNAIKVVVPDLHNPVFLNIVDGVEQYLKETDYHVVLEVTYNDKDKEIDSMSSFLDNKVDGVIISPIYETEVTRYLLENKVDLSKIVYVGTGCSEVGKIHYCAADSKTGAYKGVKHMIDKGCKRIAFLAPTVEKIQGSKRYSGYIEAISDSGMNVDEKLFANCGQGFQEIYATAYKLLDEQRPDGIFCLYDYATIPVMKAALELGMNVPNDLMITGYDNIEIGEFLERSLTTVDPYQKQQGYRAAELMVRKLRGEKPPVCNDIEPTLVIRQTTR